MTKQAVHWSGQPLFVPCVLEDRCPPLARAIAEGVVCRRLPITQQTLSINWVITDFPESLFYYNISLRNVSVEILQNILLPKPIQICRSKYKKSVKNNNLIINNKYSKINI